MKKKSELLLELAKFFKQELEPALITYEKERKANILPYAFVKLLYIGIALIFFGGWLLPFLIFAGLVLVIISTIFLFSHKKFSKTKSNKIIEMDYEMMVKRELMPKFLSLFDCGLKWYKYNDITLKTCNKVLTYNSDDKIITREQLMQFFSKCSDDVNELMIFPKFNLMTFDDIIIGHELKVPIDIIETKFGFDIKRIKAYCLNNKAGLLKLYIIMQVLPIIMIALVFFNGWLGFFLILFLFIVMFTFPFWFTLFVFIYIKTKLAHSRNLLIRFKIPKTIKGHTVVFEKNHVFLTNKGQFEQVVLENVNFENKYNTYSTDQIEARYLLTTAFISRFEDIKMAFTAKNIRAEFKDDKLSILIEVDKDMFQMGSITRETTFKTFSTMLDEIYSVLTLAEQLNLDSETRL